VRYAESGANIIDKKWRFDGNYQKVKTMQLKNRIQSCVKAVKAVIRRLPTIGEKKRTRSVNPYVSIGGIVSRAQET
jgi:hypothetical protein